MWLFMHIIPYTMSGKVFDNRDIIGMQVCLHMLGKGLPYHAWLYNFDRLIQSKLRSLNQVCSFKIMLISSDHDRKCRIRNSSFIVHSTVYLEHITFLENLAIWDSMNDTVIVGGTQISWKSVVSLKCSGEIMRKQKFLCKHFQLHRRDSWLTQIVQQSQKFRQIFTWFTDRIDLLSCFGWWCFFEHGKELGDRIIQKDMIHRHPKRFLTKIPFEHLLNSWVHQSLHETYNTLLRVHHLLQKYLVYWFLQHTPFQDDIN